MQMHLLILELFFNGKDRFIGHWGMYFCLFELQITMFYVQGAFLFA